MGRGRNSKCRSRDTGGVASRRTNSRRRSLSARTGRTGRTDERRAAGTVVGTVVGTVAGTVVGRVGGTVAGTAAGTVVGTAVDTAVDTAAGSSRGRSPSPGCLPAPVTQCLVSSLYRAPLWRCRASRVALRAMTRSYPCEKSFLRFDWCFLTLHHENNPDFIQSVHPKSCRSYLRRGGYA